MKLQHVLLIFVLGLEIASPAVAESKPEGELRIGAVLALSGDLAGLGTEVLKGAKLAVAEAEQSGLKVRLIVEDGGSLDRAAATTAAQKLLSVTNVDAGLTMIVEEAEPIAPLFNRVGVPLMVAWDSNSRLRSLGKYIFSNGFSTEAAGELAASFAHKTLKCGDVALISHNDPWAEIISPAFKDKFTALGGRVSFSEAVNPDVKDYRSIISRMKKARPACIYFPMVPMGSAEFVKQLEQQDVQLPLLTGDAFIKDVIDAAGPAADGVYFTNTWSDDADQLVKKDPEILDPILASLGFDAVKAMLPHGDLSRESITKALTQRYGSEQSANRKQKMFQVKKGQVVEVESEAKGTSN